MEKPTIEKFIKKILGNKFYLTALVFVVWVGFFDANSLLERFKNYRRNRELRETIEYYKKKIEEDSKNLNEMRTDPEVLEKFARENYFMKRDNEDIILIEEDDW
ncbi:MAG TPA: septum formation initiator family protein [Salinivirgaceae bacterium]|nr:septum formation initiator family protein [Salinivirgaceae bacterium]